MGIIENIKKSFKSFITSNIKSFSSNNYIGSVNSISSLLNNDVVFDSKLFFELYRQNEAVRQCVRKIANSVARNGLYLRDNNNQIIDDEAFEDEVAELFKDKTFLKFKVSVFRNLLISGEVYIIPSYNLYGEVKGFQVLDSQAMSKVYDDELNIIGYKYRARNGKVYNYGLLDLAFFKLEDSITNSSDGMGLLWSVIYDLLCDLEAQKTNFYFYQNSAIPSAMLLLNDGMPKKEAQIAKEEFEAQFKGSSKQHKTMVASNVKDLKVLALSNRDMEFIAQRNLTVEKVCTIFGVPKSILGKTDDVNYANSREQSKEYIEGTIKPYSTEFEHILNTLLYMFRPDIARSYYVKCDSEQLEETEELHESQRKDVLAGIMTVNEVRVDRGLEPKDDENADKLITTRNAVLLEDISLDAVLPGNEV